MAGLSALIGLASTITNDGEVTNRELMLFAAAGGLYLGDEMGWFDESGARGHNL